MILIEIHSVVRLYDDAILEEHLLCVESVETSNCMNVLNKPLHVPNPNFLSFHTKPASPAHPSAARPKNATLLLALLLQAASEPSPSRAARAGIAGEPSEPSTNPS